MFPWVVIEPEFEFRNVLSRSLILIGLSKGWPFWLEAPYPNPGRSEINDPQVDGAHRREPELLLCPEWGDPKKPQGLEVRVPCH